MLRALHSFKPVSATHFFWNGTADLTSVAGYHRDYYFSRVFTAAKMQASRTHTNSGTLLQASCYLAGGHIVEVAALLGNSVRIVEKHYATWVRARQQKLDRAIKKANDYHGLTRV